MANPRNIISFMDILPERVTYKIDNSTITYLATAVRGSAVVDRAVSMSAAQTVKLSGAGDRVVGQLISVEPDLKCVVQIGRYVVLPKGDDAAAIGLGAIVGDTLSAAPGYIKGVTVATLAEVAAGRGTVVDASVTTAVVVQLP